MTRLYGLGARARLVCTHELGRVSVAASQVWVRVDGVPLLVDHDPEGRPISGCPNLTAVTKPCTATLGVGVGYSRFVTIGGRALCLDTLQGTTDGDGGMYRYRVADPGQHLVAETAVDSGREDGHG